MASQGAISQELFQTYTVTVPLTPTLGTVSYRPASGATSITFTFTRTPANLELGLPSMAGTVDSGATGTDGQLTFTGVIPFSYRPAIEYNLPIWCDIGGVTTMSRVKFTPGGDIVFYNGASGAFTGHTTPGAYNTFTMSPQCLIGAAEDGVIVVA